MWRSMLRPMLESEWRFGANYCWGFEQQYQEGDWHFVGHQIVLLGGGGWWIEMYSLDWAELGEAVEGRGVEKTRLIGKMVGFGKVGPGLVQGQRQQELDGRGARD